MKKHGIELLQEKLAQAAQEQAGRSGQAQTAGPLPQGLAEFARRMAARQGVDPATGEVIATTPTRH